MNIELIKAKSNDINNLEFEEKKKFKVCNEKCQLYNPNDNYDKRQCPYDNILTIDFEYVITCILPIRIINCISIEKLDFNENIDIFLVGTYNGEVQALKNIDNPKLYQRYLGHESMITCLKYFYYKNQTYLVSGSFDNLIIVWEYQITLNNTKLNTFSEEAIFAKLSNHTKAVKCLSCFRLPINY